MAIMMVTLMIRMMVGGISNDDCNSNNETDSKSNRIILTIVIAVSLIAVTAIGIVMFVS